jgi:hypothetical protein
MTEKYIPVARLLTQYPVLRRARNLGIKQWTAYAPKLLKFFRENLSEGDKYRA